MKEETMEIKVEKVSRLKVLAMAAMVFATALFVSYIILYAVADMAATSVVTIRAIRPYTAGDTRTLIDAAYILLPNVTHPTLHDWRLYLAALMVANLMASTLRKGK